MWKSGEEQCRGHCWGRLMWDCLVHLRNGEGVEAAVERKTKVEVSQGQTRQCLLGLGRDAGFTLHKVGSLGGLGANRLLQASVWVEEVARQPRRRYLCLFQALSFGAKIR